MTSWRLQTATSLHCLHAVHRCGALTVCVFLHGLPAQPRLDTRPLHDLASYYDHRTILSSILC